MEVAKTSEWDARAIMAYSQIHNKVEFDRIYKKSLNMPIEKIDKYLSQYVFSLNSKNPGNIKRKNDDFRRLLYAANIANNNNPDITKVPGKDLDGIDLLTYSFPCQGLSIANMGRDKGIDGASDSTSNLIWEIRRILLEAKKDNIKLPKYLLMENVKNLLSKKHIKDYNKWVEFLNQLGYKTETVIINGFKHGSLQKRERVFALSILNHSDKKIKFKELLTRYEKSLTISERKTKYFNTFAHGNNEEIVMATPNNTPSRIMMANKNYDLLNRGWRPGYEYTFNTLTTKQDRHPNIGMIKLGEAIVDKLDHRFITPREGYIIMGFKSNDYSKVHKIYNAGHITKESLYRQAGNSIVVEVLESIFKVIQDIEDKKGAE